MIKERSACKRPFEMLMFGKSGLLLKLQGMANVTKSDVTY